jgi:anti-sigma factor RsiW
VSKDLHEQMRNLIDAMIVEDISTAERESLELHLETCEPCRRHAQMNERALQTLRSVAVRISPTLVSETQARLRLRARELHEERARMRALWVACLFSWILGVATAPLVWWGIKWLGRQFALPEAFWTVAFVLWWLVPTTVIAAVLAWRRSHASLESRYAETPRRL